MKRVVTALALFAGLAQATSAQTASPVYWSSIATACTPDATAIQTDRYQSPADSYVALRATNVDPIALICGVSPNPTATAPNTISLTYLDPTGSATAAFVKASLVRVNRNTGERAVIVAVSSNTSPGTTVRKQVAAFTSVLSFLHYYYYVRVEMDRSLATQDVRSIGVALERR